MQGENISFDNKLQYWQCKDKINTCIFIFGPVDNHQATTLALWRLVLHGQTLFRWSSVNVKANACTQSFLSSQNSFVSFTPLSSKNKSNFQNPGFHASPTPCRITSAIWLFSYYRLAGCPCVGVQRHKTLRTEWPAILLAEQERARPVARSWGRWKV